MFYSEVSSLTKNEIETILESEGFVLQMAKRTKKYPKPHPHRHAHNFKHDLVPNNVCVKTTKSDKNYFVVIHSDYSKYEEEILSIDGIDGKFDNENHYFNSNLYGFEKRVNGGENPEAYGIEINVANKISFRKFLKFLKSGSLELENPLTDIKSAEKTLSTVSETTRKAMIDARLGQGKYRRELLELWEKCAVTGYVLKDFLRASHIKPWRDSNDTEKLDKYNGLLLNPILDTAFDKGYISFKNNGAIIISKVYETELYKMGIDESMSLRKIFPENINYLEFHRENVFKK